LGISVTYIGSGNYEVIVGGIKLHMSEDEIVGIYNEYLVLQNRDIICSESDLLEEEILKDKTE